MQIWHILWNPEIDRISQIKNITSANNIASLIIKIECKTEQSFSFNLMTVGKKNFFSRSPPIW